MNHQPATTRDRDFERIYFGDRCVNPTHFFSAFIRPDGGETFAFGYWSHDGMYFQGFVTWHNDHFGRPVFNTAN